jgi:hypothetical protein
MASVASAHKNPSQSRTDFHDGPGYSGARAYLIATDVTVWLHGRQRLFVLLVVPPHTPQSGRTKGLLHEQNTDELALWDAWRNADTQRWYPSKIGLRGQTERNAVRSMGVV